jgi:hypothetical protein
MVTDSGIGIDVTLSGLSTMSDSLQRSSKQEFIEGVALKICSAEDLIILKTIAGRDRDWIDIESVIIRQSRLDWVYVLATLESLTDNEVIPDRVQRLETLRLRFYQK